MDTERLLGEAERRWQALLTERPDLRPAGDDCTDCTIWRRRSYASRGPQGNLRSEWLEAVDHDCDGLMLLRSGHKRIMATSMPTCRPEARFESSDT